MTTGTLDAVPDGDLDPELLARQGRAIIRWGWVANVLFAVTAIPVAVGVDDALGIAIGVALLLFLVAVVAFVLRVRGRPGAQRAGRQRRRRQPLLPAGLRAQADPAPVPRGCSWCAWRSPSGTAAWEPFGVLVPMLPVGLAGVWAARYGVFPPRPAAARVGRA